MQLVECHVEEAWSTRECLVLCCVVSCRVVVVLKTSPASDAASDEQALPTPV